MKTNQKTVLFRSGIFKVGLVAIAATLLAACGARATVPTAAPAAAPAVPATEAPKPTEAPAAAPTEAPKATEAPAAAPTEAPKATEAAAAPAAAGSVFQIDPAQSKATFTLNEKLMGNPVTVVGATSLVSGKITLSPDNLANTQIGAIQIDARDFKTDSTRRDGAMQRFILESTKDEYQYITFEPTAIEGLPATVKTGESATFKITGNLKIRSIVKPVTFDATVTAKSDTELAGSVKTTVLRSNFELTIPSIPSVADVTDEVALELTFVATKQ